MRLRKHITIGLSYFMMAAVLGVVLRAMRTIQIPVNYRFLVHTHSHIALLGWVYIALTTLLFGLYLNQQKLDRKYKRIFWFTQITLIGMLISFPIQGYALFSIIFSTLFLIASYWFTYFFSKNVSKAQKANNSYKCIKWALAYMVISSVGPWALGAIMGTLGAESVWYRLAIYFYLHFQYNGWMVLALVGALLYGIEQGGLLIPKKRFNLFFWSMNIGIVLSFFLSTLWTRPTVLFYVLGGIGALFQICAFGFLVWIILGFKHLQNNLFSALQRRMLRIVTLFYGVKILLQLFSAFPYFSNLVATVIDFTIGYLHWTFLGVVTLGLFLLLDFFKLLQLDRRGYYIYLIGFVGTEILIFYKGIMAWQRWPIFDAYYEVLAVVSLLLPLALLYILWTNIKTDWV